MAVIIFQGQYYWLLKLRKPEGGQFEETAPFPIQKMPAHQLGPGCVDATVLGWQVAMRAGHQVYTEVLGWALAANCFAILEYVNYYYFQLMIDSKSDLAHVIRCRGMKGLVYTKI